ncbi:MAG: thioredoxin-disulfide reductase [Candidatus Margulisiibacteriota bacterium]
MIIDSFVVAEAEELVKDRPLPFDTVVIGGGPAGLTAGLYCARSGMKTLLIERAILGGQVSLCSSIENYPGFPSGISGIELAARFEDQAKKFGVETVWGEVQKISVEGSLKKVELIDNTFSAKTMIIAIGTEPKKLGIPGESEFRGKGVSYCATCDGAFYKGKEIVLIGGGNSAISEAIFLTKFASKVTVVHRRDHLRADQILAERAFSEPKIDIVWDSVPEAINGAGAVESVTVKNVKDGTKKDINCDGVFIYIGEAPSTALFKDVLKLSPEGFIVVDGLMRTSGEGVFAAGDVCQKNFRQIATAVGDGAIAADSARKYLENML